MQIQFQDVSHRYVSLQADVSWALANISLTINQGDSLSVLGQTGSGKSTFIRVMCGLSVPSRGDVLVDGVSTRKRSLRNRLPGRIGYLFQNSEAQFFHANVYDDIATGPRNLGLSEDEVAAKVAGSMQAVGLPASFADRSPYELSGGEQRRVALAGILVMQPDVLIVDEPTAMLDAEQRERVLTILQTVKEQGTTLILVTHRPQEALYLTNQTLILVQGRMAHLGLTRDLFSTPKPMRDAGLELPLPTLLHEGILKQGVDVPEPWYVLNDVYRWVKTHA